MKTCRVFYSWQSDLPNATNRTFIEKALKNATKSIIADESIQIEPVIERDTAGVPGAPDIAATILAKIDQSQIFVCDVTIINNKSDPRPMPNPNVLIELGYAMKTLGPQRIIMVMNSAFGGPELLPFDLRLKRVTVYHLPPEEIDRTSERNIFVSQLEQGLRTILADLNSQSQIITQERLPIEDQVIEAIENSLPNKTTLVKKYMPWWLTQIEQVAPPFPDQPVESESDDLLMNGLAQTIQLVYKFARLAETIAVSDTTPETALIIYKTFEQVIERYSLPLGFSGRFRETKFDFYKFIGHEIFVIFFSFLIRENRWDLVAGLLEEGFYVTNFSSGMAGLEPFTSMSRFIELFRYRKSRLKLNRISIHADLLNERHTNGDLGVAVPIRQFIGADFFLFLRSGDWSPWSTLYMIGQPPRYLIEATNTKYAKQLLRPLAVETIESLRALIVERVKAARLFFNSGLRSFPLEGYDVNKIASM